MARALHRLGLLAARRKWVVLAVWIVGIAALATMAKTFGSNTSNNLDLPGTNSQAATDLLATRFPPQQNGSNPLVFHTQTGKVTDAKNKQAIEAAYKQVKTLPHVAGVVDPFSQQGACADQQGQDDRVHPGPARHRRQRAHPGDRRECPRKPANPGVKAGMEVAVGGSVGGELSEPETESSEVIGLIAATIILAFTFGTLVAMGLPIVSAVFGLIVGLSLITAPRPRRDRPDDRADARDDDRPRRRHRLRALPRHAPPRQPQAGHGDARVDRDGGRHLGQRDRLRRDDRRDRAPRAPGRRDPAGDVARLLLGRRGRDRRARLPHAAAGGARASSDSTSSRAACPQFLRPSPKDVDRGFWGGWARALTRRPWWAILAVFALLIPLIVPFLSLNLGQEDIGATPKSTTERQAYDLMSAGFGVGYNGPLLVAVDLGSPAKQSSEYTSQYNQAQSLQKQLEQEQKSGKTQQQQLQAQANSLTAQSRPAHRAAEAARAAAGQPGGAAGGARASGEGGQAGANADPGLREQARGRAGGAEQTDRRSGRAGEEGRQRRREDDQEADLDAEEADEEPGRAEEGREADRARDGPESEEEARGEAGALQKQETKLERQLEKLVQEEQANREALPGPARDAQSLRKQEVNVANRAISLAGQSAALASDAVALVQQKQALVLQASDLQVQAANLQTQAADLQTQAAQLQTQQVELQGQQQSAQSQQKQAEQLQSELTDELTQAGGDPRGTDTRLVNLQNALGATEGVKVVSPPRINKPGNAATFNVIATTAPAAPATADLVRTLREVHDPAVDPGHECEGVRRRPDGELRRPRQRRSRRGSSW